MKCLSKKLLSIFMVLCLTLMSFGLVINVNAANSGDITFVVDTNNFSTAPIKDTTNTYSMNFAYSGLEKKTDYIMFNQNQGVMYSSSVVEGYYPSKVYIEFTGGTSTTGQVKISFSKAEYSNRDSGNHTATRNGNYSLTNDDQTNLFWNLSTSTKNVQIKVLKVTYSKKIVQTKLSAPTVIMTEGNTLMFDAIQNATGYVVGFFNSLEDTTPYYEMPELTEAYNTDGITTTLKIAEQGDFIVRVKAVSSDIQYLESDYSTEYAEYAQNEITNLTINEFKSKPIDQKTIKTYYELFGQVTKITDASKGIFTLKNGNDEIVINGLKSQKNKVEDDFASLNIKENDLISINGYVGGVEKNVQVEGAYLKEKVNDPKTIFTYLETKASLNVNYATKALDTVLLEKSFVSNRKDDKNLDDWAGTVGGTYSGSFYQSFRKDGHNVESPKFEKQGEIKVDFTYYLNKAGSDPINNGSTLTFKGLDEQGKEVATFTTETLASELMGSDNVNTLTVLLTGNNICKLRIEFNKNSGNNVAFSNVTIKSTRSYEITQDDTLKNSISLRFGGMINKDLYDQLIQEGSSVTFGVLYAKKSELNGKTFEEAYVEDNVAIKNIECLPVLVNDLGTEEDPNGTKYQFSVVINHIPTEAFGDAVTAACYVNVDGTYYLMQISEYSVNSIAQFYVDNLLEDPTVSAHAKMLRWLAKLNA